MNFQNMEYFLKVVEKGTITDAARELSISQQALSNTILRMEQELGCSLFERRQGLVLTYAGKKFQEAAVKMLDIEKQTKELLSDISGNIHGELRIGIAHTRGQALLPLILPEFITKYPSVQLSVLEDSTRELERHLERGDLDVVIGFAPFMFEGAMTYPLMKEQFYLVLPKSLLEQHFGKENCPRVLGQFKEEQNMRLFKDLPFVLLKEGDRVRTIAASLFKEAGFEPNIILETSNTQTALSLSSEGVGLTICPQLYLNSNYIASGFPDAYIRRHIEICPLTLKEEVGYIAIGYNKERYLSRVAEDFIRIARQKLAGE